MTRHSGEIFEAMQQLEGELRKALKEEMKDMDTRHLAQIVDNRSSGWSGGFSLTNYQEQAARQTASQLLMNKLDKIHFAKD